MMIPHPGWIPALPLITAVILLLVGNKLPKWLISLLGVGSVGGAAAVAAVICGSLAMDTNEAFYRALCWQWISVDNLSVEFALKVDALSAWMIAVITGIGFLIHLYASEYMQKDQGMARFFGVLNLFVAAMLTLVMADNLLVLFLGWEGVGLCSYLLIGFWHEKSENVLAARKAFLVTRIGDVALAIAMFALVAKTGTLDIPSLLEQAPTFGPMIAALILVGAMGKSGQVPLHIWLPDAMAGPTPVSAMIHAATMVAAGVYLIARLHPIFLAAPSVLFAVAVVGALTMVVAGFAALGQVELKRILAYSTVSQLGYMFLALGAMGWQAAIFHFTTHAAFKALLFLAAGSVIEAAHHTSDIRKLGGLRTSTPFLFGVFTIGAGTLAALPLVTSAFFSKDEILAVVFTQGPNGLGPALAILGVFGGFLTALYSFRMWFLVFFGPERTPAHDHSGWRIRLPLLLLAVMSIGFSVLALPGISLPHRVLHGVLGEGAEISHAVEFGLMGASAVMSLFGLGLAAALYRKGDDALQLGLFREGFHFDATYDLLIARPFLAIVGEDREDLIGRFSDAFKVIPALAQQTIARLQTGQIQWYAAAVIAAVIALVGYGEWK